MFPEKDVRIKPRREYEMREEHSTRDGRSFDARAEYEDFQRFGITVETTVGS